MPRVTATEVKVILPTSTSLTDPQIEAAIAAATVVVDQIAAGCASGLTTDALKQVELYLAAHFASVTENTLSVSSETSDCLDASVKYGFKFGEGVKGTPFGQMANTISQGCLAENDKRPASMFSIGSHGGSVIQ